MDERIEKYFYEELSRRNVYPCCMMLKANEELKRQFAEYQNMYALLNLGHQVEKQNCR